MTVLYSKKKSEQLNTYTAYVFGKYVEIFCKAIAKNLLILH